MDFAQLVGLYYSTRELALLDSSPNVSLRLLPRKQCKMAAVKIKRRQHLVKKEIEPLFTKEEMKAGRAKTNATCPFCGFGRALFKQMQIRSADEPASTIYECLKCEKIWRED